MVENAGKYSKIKSIEQDGIEDVFCLSVPETQNFIANGIVVHNCDALRYAIASHKISVYDPYKQTEIQKEWMKNRYEPTRRY